MTLKKCKREIEVTKTKIARNIAHWSESVAIEQRDLRLRLDALEEIERLYYKLQLKIVQLEDFYR